MQSAISISVVTIGFIVYYFTITNPALAHFFKNKHGKEQSKISWIIFQRLTGVAIFGIVPIVVSVSQNLDFETIGLTLNHKSTIWEWILGLSLLCTIINFFAAKKPDHLEIYPQIRTPQPWSKSLLFGSALTLFLYTLAYEVMFRGYLLFTCKNELGIELAIVINTAIYALVHIPKGWKETVGAFPMGIILCYLSLSSGSIWIAVAVHVALAWTSEWFSIYYGNLAKEGIYRNGK